MMSFKYSAKALQMVSDFIYPPLCLHCRGSLVQRQHLFCPGCTCFFELIDPSTRCVYCFSENDGRRPCTECIQKKHWQVKVAAALDGHGPVNSFIKQMKNGRMPYLAKTGAAFLLAQFDRLQWPLPDLIVPIPSRNWFQGMDHVRLLAKELAKYLSTSCTPLLKCCSENFSEGSDPLVNFRMKPNLQLDGKVVLLIDDVITTGATLRRSADVIWDAFPKQVMALTVVFSSCL